MWVYHKGNPKARELAELRTATARLAELKLALGLPNVGRAKHTCVHHVVQNYARLADFTLFLKDTALAHAHLGVATRLLAFARQLPTDVDMWCARPPVAANLSFALDSYQSETCWRFGRCYGNESWKLASARPFGAWLASHGITPIQSMPRGQVQACYGGFFAASRRAVLTTPKATYAAIEEELMQADSLEEGHYMERTFGQPSLACASRCSRSSCVSAFTRPCAVLDRSTTTLSICLELQACFGRLRGSAYQRSTSNAATAAPFRRCGSRGWRVCCAFCSS